ncbi:cytochrome P450 [Phanerochaete sordida]|uniref:Cytochrome P450 n=1 Tax=Phanerochaete sordida TaxID=48140 RepID=A0A9P3GIV1_9APHY|nr:cytochrome P450 [Phanerochaete sordida]
MSYTLLAFAVCVLIPVVGILLKRSSRPAPFPPGPPPDPIIGHVRSFPRDDPHLGLMQLAKQYGDVMYFNLLGKQFVVLSSHAAATDLLEKRSAIYSSRPYLPLHNLVGWDDMLAFLPYERFQAQRKVFHQAFTRPGCVPFRAIQLQQAQVLLKNLLRDPARHVDHTGRFATAVVMEIAYGHKIVSDDDPYIAIAGEINDILGAIGDVSIVDFFPALQHIPAWFPGAGFKRTALHFNETVKKTRTKPLNMVRREMEAGTAQPSFLSMQLEELERNGETSEEEINLRNVSAAHLYGAGAETTWSSIRNFIAVMLLHPEVQRKAQEEIDRVVGPGRLPDFSDRDSLPYLDCVLYETIRWCPTTPLGIPHATVADDVYKGMFIPKGSTVIFNAKAIAMDETVYKNPTKFYPERFLPENGEPLPTHITFGFGRRICPGRYLADASLWIVMASVLAAFRIAPALDASGREIPPDVKFTARLTCHPEPFRCDIRPRSDSAARLIQDLQV